MLRRPAFNAPDGLQEVEFLRAKYGRELSIDAAFVHAMPTFLASVARPHVLSFYDMLLVTRGRGQFTLDGERYALSPGTLVLSAPGEARQLEVRDLDGACLFFTEEFVLEAFLDARLLQRSPCFRRRRPSPVLALDAMERRLFLGRFRVMQREIAGLRTDASDALRAVLYEVLVLVNRWYAARHGGPPSRASAGPVESFQASLERDFARRRRVADYAREVGVSAGHLSALCRGTLRRTAGACIRARVTLEAKRLLAYTDLTAAEVSARLGFEDAAYFARFFRREAGISPTRFRADRRLSPPLDAREAPQET